MREQVEGARERAAASTRLWEGSAPSMLKNMEGSVAVEEWAGRAAEPGPTGSCRSRARLGLDWVQQWAAGVLVMLLKGHLKVSHSSPGMPVKLWIYESASNPPSQVRTEATRWPLGHWHVGSSALSWVRVPMPSPSHSSFFAAPLCLCLQPHHLT